MRRHPESVERLNDHRLEGGGFDSRLKARPEFKKTTDSLSPGPQPHAVRGSLELRNDERERQPKPIPTHWKFSPGRREFLYPNTWTIMQHRASDPSIFNWRVE